jgi:sirohydrochlorin ferrochelatase
MLSWSIVSPAQTEGRVGVLVIAHGGTNQWNGTVRKTVGKARVDSPTEIALGMGMHDGEVRRLRQIVDRLERKGISRIVVVPLFVSSHSEVFRQYEYLLGLREKPEWPEAGAPLALEVPVTMGRALDDDPLVADVLTERATALSRAPERETVILVAHGPNAEADNRLWLQAMESVATTVKERGNFRDVQVFTMRDDAEKAVRDQAQQALRKAVAAAGRDGRALVVPVLIAQGGVERKIPKMLTGLSYAYDGQTLLPHHKLVEWIARQATELSAAEPTERSTAAGAVVE